MSAAEATSRSPHPDDGAVATEKGEAPVEVPKTDEAADARRFAVLCAFSVFSMSNASHWIMYAPIAHEAKEYFDMNTLELNTMSSVYMVVYFCGAYLTCTSMQRMGLTFTIRTGAALTLLGAIVKFLAAAVWPNFLVNLIGQTIEAVAQLAVLSVPTPLADTWFPCDERNLATSVMVSANNIGNALGLLIPPLIVHPGNHGKSAFMLLFGLEAGFSLLAFILVLVLIPSVAPKRSTPAAAVDGTLASSAEADPEESPLQATWVLVKNFNFLRLLLGAGCNIGLCWALNSFLAQIALPFGIAEQTTGWAGFAAIIIGTITAAGIGNFVDRTRIYKPPLIILLTVSTLGIAGTLTTLEASERESFVMRFFFIGTYTIAAVAQNSLMPAAYQFGAEISYPIPEGYSSTLIAAIANLLSFICVIVFAIILGDESPAKPERAITVLACFVGLLVVSSGICYTVTSDLRRTDDEDRREREAKAAKESASEEPKQPTSDSEPLKEEPRHEEPTRTEAIEPVVGDHSTPQEPFAEISESAEGNTKDGK